jgi:pre-mRNA-splicing helicase BRR2
MDTTLDDDVGVAVEFEEDEDEESDFDQVPHFMHMFN